ncbi:hypothetical protein IU427_34025 [Nocardia beijingensis]|uniref:hypothetical protein n=1 Tax=Nocardia beijingensis TaxID=95162 RepID=UPI0018934033|nr:hypothetical protein [Nocardia beijingensis]MBF6470129.1 hypothetical protein [Nocardia beijingensis]
MSDYIALGSAGTSLVSVVLAGWAIRYARSQARTVKEALAESRRAADAGEKSARAADQAVQLSAQADQLAALANRIAQRGNELSTPPAIAWRIEHLAGDDFRLRKIGTVTARNVHMVTPPRGDVGGPMGIPPNGWTQFWHLAAIAPSGLRVVQIWIKWDGQPAAVPVPMP